MKLNIYIYVQLTIDILWYIYEKERKKEVGIEKQVQNRDGETCKHDCEHAPIVQENFSKYFSNTYVLDRSHPQICRLYFS